MNAAYLERELDEIEKLGVPYFDLEVRQNHEVIFAAERGHGGRGKRFFLFSCTKPITSACSLRLMEEGKLDIDAPVSRYLPAYANAFVLKDGKPCPPDTVMTLRHLFTMSAGLDYNLRSDPIRKAAAQPDADTVSIANAFIESPLSFSPGQRYQYSLCLDTLGAVIEQASGMSLADCMRERFFEPLGMKDTSFKYNESELAQKYVYNAGEYLPDKSENAYILSEKYCSGGAGLVSTARDLALFADALACGGTGVNGARLLRPETVDLMRSDQMPRVLREQNFSCAGGEEFSYALGVHTLVRKLPSTRAPYGVFGWDGAAGAYMMSDTENRLSISFIMHVHNWPSIRPCFHRPLRNAVYTALEG
ncbi:MAG: serine hydrolase [Clostridia bacterium]|nr:serine hydrolase [Clostridia bacterium]